MDTPDLAPLPAGKGGAVPGMLTDKGRLAVAAMIELALRSENAPVALAVVGERQQISMSYLEQLFGRLRRNGLVRGTLGPGGGYVLGRSAARISVADIIRAVDDPAAAVRRRAAAELVAGTAGRRSTQRLWDGVNARLTEHFDAITLKALVDERNAVEPSTAGVSIRRGISTRPVLKPIVVTAPNSVFALADA